MSTPNNGIPYVPEDTQDPAAGLNLALNVIDALLQLAVIRKDLTAPPGSPADGDRYLVAPGATGAWAGQDNNLARYVAEGDFWQFYEHGVHVHQVLNLDDAGIYAWNGAAWAAVAGVPEAPIDGKIYGRKDAGWEEISGGGGGSDIIDVESPSNVAGTVTLDFDSKSRYVGAITLTGNVSTLAFANLPGSGKFAEYELHITQDGSGGHTFALPASHKALGGSDTVIASAPNAVTVLTASTVDNGTTWRYAMQESA